MAMSCSDAPPPWKRKNPKKTTAALSPQQKSEARARARKAGRKYPNLVDNMAVARKRNDNGAKKRAAGAATANRGARRRCTNSRSSTATSMTSRLR